MTRTKSFVRVAGSTSCLLATPVLVEATPTEDKYAFLKDPDDKPDPEAVAAYEKAKKMLEDGLSNGPAWPGEEEGQGEKETKGRSSSSSKAGRRKKRRASSSGRKKEKNAREGDSNSSTAGSVLEDDAASASVLLQTQIAMGFEKMNKRLEDLEARLAEIQRPASTAYSRSSGGGGGAEVSQQRHLEPNPAKELSDQPTGRPSENASAPLASAMVQTRPAATAGALAELPGAPSPFDDGLQTLRDVEPVWHLVVQGLALEAMVKPFFVAAYPGLVGEPQYVPMMLKYSTTTDMEKRGHDATAEELFAETQANIISWAEEFVPLSGYSLRGSFLEIYPHKKKRPFGEIELPNSLAAVTRVVDGMLQIKKAVPDAEWRKDVAEAAVKCAIAVWTGIGIALGVAPEARRPWIVNPEDCGGEEVSAHTDIKGLAAVGIYSSEQVLGQRQLNEAGKAFVLALGKTKFLWSGPKSEQDSAFPVPSVAHLPVKNAVEHLLPYEVFDSPSRTDVNAAGTIMNPGTTWPLLTSTGSDEKFLTAVDMLPDVISLASRTTKQARERVYAYLAQQNAARRTPTPGSTGGSGCAEDGIVMPYRPGPMAEGGTGSGSGTSDATSTLCVRVPGFDLARREAAAPPPEDRPG